MTSVGNSGVNTESRTLLRLKRKYNSLAGDIKSIRDKGVSALTNEQDNIVFLGMCKVLTIKFDRFMELWEEAIDYSEAQSLDPAFPSSDDTTYLNGVKSCYYEAMGYQETLERRSSTSVPVNSSSLNLTQRSSQQLSDGHHKLFLPKIKIKPFSGELSEWPAFKQLYCSLIMEERTLSNAERFHFLTSYLEGAAYDCIKHIPVTEANFQQAWAALSKIYDDERKLACSYLEKFLSYKSCSGKPTAASLQQYLSNVSESITSLQNLRIPNLSDYLLCELALRSLDPSTREDFEISIVGTTFPTFNLLQTFVQNRCQVLRLTEGVQQSSKVQPHHSSSPSTKPKQPNSYSPKGKYTNHALLTQSGSSSNQNNPPSKPNVTPKLESSRMSCFICKGAHIIRSCERFNKASPSQRLDMLRQYPGCKNCFHPRHRTKECQSKFRCRECDGLHNTSLHLTSTQSSSSINSQSSSLSSKQPSQQQDGAANNKPSPSSSSFIGSSTSPSQHGVLLGTVMATIRDVNGKPKRYRGVLDIGSQFSFITEQCAKELGKSTRPFKGGISGVNQSTLNHISGKISISFLSNSSNLSLETDAVVVPSITPPLPQVALKSSIWQDYLSYDLSDPNFTNPGDISFLIGADLYTEVVTGAPITIHHNSPRLMDTIFGFVVVGKYNDKSQYNQSSIALLSCNNTSDILQKFWEIEEPVAHPFISPEDELCEKHFVSTHRRTEEGRYVISLPFKSEQPHILPYTSKALSRLYSLESKLAKNPSLKRDYHAFMDEYLALGHMSVATCEPGYVIPHHPVYKFDSDGHGKLRVVFDASFKTATGSLNDHMLTGPKLQAEISDIVLNFRRFKYVLTCDIVKMFRQILVNPSDQHYQQIVWRSDPSLPITFYQLKTVTYGLRSSPFLAQRVLKQLVLDEGSKYPDAANAILHHTYVDDIATGCDHHEDLHNLRDQLIALLQCGGFQLSKWNTNYPPLFGTMHKADQVVQLGPEETSTKLLGMQWNPVSDMLSYKVEQPQLGFTKRIILSNIARLFDPLGYLTPVIFYAKTILQETWKSAISWDDEVPSYIKSMWEKFINELTSLSNIHVPRFLPQTISNYQLICFCDASVKGYCAAVYLRAAHESSASVTLIKAKSRLAPLKTLTIPRLELCGAVLLSQLISSLQPLIENLNINQTFCFTDSSVVLAWLRTPPHSLQIFVANRVQKVLQVTSLSWWHHIRGTDNPADVGSRGLLPSSLSEHPLWWTGPVWCSLPLEDWPISSEVSCDNLPELKKSPHLSLATIRTSLDFIKLTERFSSFPRLIRVLAYVKRFIYNCMIPKRKRGKRRKGKAVTSIEYDAAKSHCLRLVQRHFYPEPFTTVDFNDFPLELRRLAVFIDHNGVLRVGGRISKAPISLDHKYPVLLPSRSHITMLIIAMFHNQNHHAGPSATLAAIRQQFWIPRARTAIKQHKSRCITCVRFSKSATSPFMGDMPKSRFNCVRPFANTGIDFAGPFLCKTSVLRKAPSIKSYLCIFICLSTRAVHLELATALTVEAFLDAFDRFVARRSLPSSIYSDCGTNFVGAAGYIKDLLEWYHHEETQSSIIHHTAHLSVQWNFNPPSSPHFGGSWESAVKSAKLLLLKTFGNRPYLQDELSTMFTKVEGILNSRPLLPLSDSPADVEALTPGHFLVGQPINALPEQDLSEVPYHQLNRWQMLRERVQHFWDRWRSEYLSSLQIRQKWQHKLPNLEVGDVVIVKDSNLTPTHWPLGRITAVHPGADGIVRVVTLRTSRGIFKRPSVKLVKLHLEEMSA